MFVIDSMQLNQPVGQRKENTQKVDLKCEYLIVDTLVRCSDLTSAYSVANVVNTGQRVRTKETGKWE